MRIEHFRYAFKRLNGFYLKPHIILFRKPLELWNEVTGESIEFKSVDDVIDYVHSQDLKELLNTCKDEHDKLNVEIQKLLEKYNDEGKDPNPIAKGMSWMKTNMKLVMNESDNTIADLMTDGCNMGVKSLNKYLNEYEAADEVSKDIAKRLINLEEKLIVDIRDYL
jgi:hypothetical protein